MARLFDDMEIGIIADTHSFFDPNLPEIFEKVDEIWHAGDFGNLEIANQLAQIKPTKGVYGNIDTEVANKYRRKYKILVAEKTTGLDYQDLHSLNSVNNNPVNRKD